jgi:YVTN family beta-propeller protein
VANSGGNTVSVINTTSDVVTNTIAVGSHPVGLAETPNGQKLYVVNQGDGTVSSINTIDGSVNLPIPVGGTPVWAVARSDSARIYALDSSTGTISTIMTGPPDILLLGSNPSAGAGANFMAYDRTFNRLYVTNPTAGNVSVFDASSDPPVQRGSSVAIAAAPSSPCTTTPVPISVTVLGDGSRAYVASFQLDSGTVCSQVSVIDSGTDAVTTIIPLPQAPDMSSQTGCAAARFRAFVASSGGGSTTNFKVYVSQCDAGSIAVIDTFADNSGSSPHPADVYTVSLAAPLSSFPPLQASISGATISNGAITYTYTPSGLGLQVGMSVLITGMSNSGNNGYFVISAVNTVAGTFTVANPLGVSASSQNGSGTVLAPQNPVFVVAGP